MWNHSVLHCVLIALGVLYFGEIVWAEEGSPCEEGTARGLMKCGEDALAQADAEMGKVYSKLLASLPPQATASDQDMVTKRNLVAAQKAWLQARDKNCGIRAALPRASWQWASGKADLCRAYAAQQRTKELQMWLGCVLGQDDEHGSLCGAL